jgi:putative membrane protein
MKKERGWRWAIIFATCTLAVPMAAALMGYYGGTMPTIEQARPALVTGALLGAAHLLLRPILRVVSAPLGCMTLGLFGMVIDVGLLYGCAYLVKDFEVPGLLYAVLTAVAINGICALAAGRK